MMTREEAEKELIAMLEEAEGGPSYSICLLYTSPSPRD